MLATTGLRDDHQESPSDVAIPDVPFVPYVLQHAERLGDKRP
jgi:hypothetical protein